MQNDPYTRAILTFIALCLLVLVAQGFGLGEPEPTARPASERGPWTVQMVRTGIGGPPTFVRLNSATGEVWHLRFGSNQEWALMGEVEEEDAEAAPQAPAAAPAPPPAQPPAPQAAPEPAPEP